MNLKAPKTSRQNEQTYKKLVTKGKASYVDITQLPSSLNKVDATRKANSRLTKSQGKLR